MKLICIDDNNKPNEVKSSNWIKKGQEYTLVKTVFSVIENKRFVVLEEVQPDQPYGGYLITRFGLIEETTQELLEVIKQNNIAEEVYG